MLLLLEWVGVSGTNQFCRAAKGASSYRHSAKSHPAAERERWPAGGEDLRLPGTALLDRLALITAAAGGPTRCPLGVAGHSARRLSQPDEFRHRHRRRPRASGPLLPLACWLSPPRRAARRTGLASSSRGSSPTGTSNRTGYSIRRGRAAGGRAGRLHGAPLLEPRAHAAVHGYPRHFPARG